MNRWRPVCPECGYSVRGLTQPRCPECGVDLPTANRTFRRWAVQRIPWDRVQRGGVVTAYLRTLLRILLTPWQAGRSFAVPDRWGRAVRWTVVHLLLAAIAATLLGNGQYFPRWFAERLHPSPFHHPALFFTETDPAHCVLTWLAQTLAAWMVVLITYPLVGVLLSLGIPGRHRAAKLGGAKWSLYVSPVILATLAGWYGCYFLRPSITQTSFPVSFSMKMPPPPLPAWLIACVFGVWWAAGMAANPYNRTRRIPPFLFFGLLYAAAWLVLTRLLLPGGALEALL